MLRPGPLTSPATGTPRAGTSLGEKSGSGSLLNRPGSFDVSARLPPLNCTAFPAVRALPPLCTPPVKRMGNPVSSPAVKAFLASLPTPLVHLDQKFAELGVTKGQQLLDIANWPEENVQSFLEESGESFFEMETLKIGLRGLKGAGPTLG